MRGNHFPQGFLIEHEVLRVYPRVCGGTCLGVLPRIVPLLPVYPRVCGGTQSRAASLGVHEAWVYPRVCGGTLSSQTYHSAGA